jgi:hypothetical protein
VLRGDIKVITSFHAERSADPILMLADPMVKVGKAKSPVFTDPCAWDLAVMSEALECLHMHAEIGRGFLSAEQFLEILIVSMLHFFFHCGLPHEPDLIEETSSERRNTHRLLKPRPPPTG